MEPINLTNDGLSIRSCRLQSNTNDNHTQHTDTINNELLDQEFEIKFIEFKDL